MDDCKDAKQSAEIQKGFNYTNYWSEIAAVAAEVGVGALGEPLPDQQTVERESAAQGNKTL